MPILHFALAAAQAVVAAPAEPEIVVTASLEPIAQADAPVSVTVIDSTRVRALGEPLALDLLRLAPGVSVATSGSPGSQAQVRIRGAEANHTLLLIDGIRFNDPASGNEARFELLGGDGIDRIEVVRGPQSALYGAEAIGGVVGVRTGVGGNRANITAEAGGKGFRRLSGSGELGDERASFGMYGGYQESGGIDSFEGDPGGDRDGYDNLTFGASLRVDGKDRVSVSAAGRFTETNSDYDSFDPVTFARADTADSTRNRVGAGRVSAAYGDAASSPLHLAVGATLLASTNRNRLDGDPLNRTSGRRWTTDALASAGFATGGIQHRLIVAGDYEQERFVASDQNYGGGTGQRRMRERGAVVGELRSRLGDRVTTDVAVRHDGFEGFRDATTVRASMSVRVAGPVSALASYGTGIARPTFFDLFGFFPGSFVGNPALRPERSRGGEIGVRYDGAELQLGVTAYRQRLRDEIVPVSNPDFTSSAANAIGTSRRRGIEVEGAWALSPALRLQASYAYLDADEPTVDGNSQVKEVRRPSHSASLSADGRLGALGMGLSLAYVGARIDSDFGTFPATSVRLGDYLLAGARVAYRVTPGIELFARAANLFDANYQDVFGYRTQGRTVYGGIRLRHGD